MLYNNGCSHQVSWHEMEGPENLRFWMHFIFGVAVRVMLLRLFEIPIPYTACALHCGHEKFLAWLLVVLLLLYVLVGVATPVRIASRPKWNTETNDCVYTLTLTK